MLDKLKEFLDGTLGSPKEVAAAALDISRAVSHIETAKLRLLKEIAVAMSSIQGPPPDIKELAPLIHELKDTDIEKIKAVKDVIVSMTKLINTLPPEMRKFNISELVSTLKNSE